MQRRAGMSRSCLKTSKSGSRVSVTFPIAVTRYLTGSKLEEGKVYLAQSSQLESFMAGRSQQ